VPPLENPARAAPELSPAEHAASAITALVVTASAKVALITLVEAARMGNLPPSRWLILAPLLNEGQ
jgi:hypothetical protein